MPSPPCRTDRSEPNPIRPLLRNRRLAGAGLPPRRAVVEVGVIAGQHFQQALGRLLPGRNPDAVLLQSFGPIYRAACKKKDRQDALHDLIVKIGKKPDHLLPEYGQDVYAWVMTVVTNHLRDDYRLRSNRERILREHQGEIAETVMQALHDQSHDPADIICGTIPVDLPPGQAQVAVLLSYGYSRVETAAILGVTPDAVFQRLSKIRRKMQDVSPRNPRVPDRPNSCAP